MEAAPGSPPQPLGVLLVENGLLSQEQLSAALAEQQQTGRPLGEIVVAHGWVSGPLVAQALATQRGGLTKTEYGCATAFTSGEEAAPPPPVAPPPVTVEEPARPALRLATPPRVSPDSGLRLAPGASVPAEQPLPLVPPPAVEPAAEAVPAPSTETPAEAPASEADELRARIAELELIADAAATNTGTARSQAAAAQAELQAAQAETEAMRERLSALEQRSGVGEADALRARLAELDAGANDAKAREAEALEQLGAAQAEAEALRERISTVEAQAADTGEADALRARVAELETTIAEARTREEQALEELHAAAAERGELEAVRVEADALRRRLAALEEQAATTGENDALQARVAELEATIAETTGREHEAHAEAEALRKRIAEETQASKGRVAELEAVAAGLRAEFEAGAHAPEGSGGETSGRLEVLELRLDQAHHQLSALQAGRDLLVDVERRLAAALSEQAATSAKLRMLEQELAERTRAYVEVADELARLHDAVPAEPAMEAAARHLVFVTQGAAYEILELEGPPPAPGDVVDLESGSHLVVRVGGSPLAGSRLPCAYTIPG